VKKSPPPRCLNRLLGRLPLYKQCSLASSKVAPSDSTILVTGETGTGKELVARAIHRRSRRGSRRSWRELRGDSRDLIASELFGHEKGRSPEPSNGGLVVRTGHGRNDLPGRGRRTISDTQVALLRVLRSMNSNGGGRERIQSMFASSPHESYLTAAMATARCQDLFIDSTCFPPDASGYGSAGRHRRARGILSSVATRGKAGKTFRRVSKRTLDRLQSYLWPGNVRELQNVIERS